MATLDETLARVLGEPVDSASVSTALPPPWTCQRDGHCCTAPPFIEMTWAEKREVERAALTVGRRHLLRWRAGDRPSTTRLVGRPCPLYDADAKACTIYDARPFNCRRFGCLRRDVTTEIFSDKLHVMLTKPNGRAELQKLQDAATPWALAHGWKPEWQ